MDQVDLLWVVICCMLVFTMQAGFMCLESGLTRSKNSLNVAIKNITDFATSFITFWIVGFGIMFGSTMFGFFGTNGYFLNVTESPEEIAILFLFHALFSGTATTIVSGIVAERMRFKGYILVSILISGVIYPFYGHWAWKGVEGALDTGWLRNLGFIDFAGSTVVHSVGAWVGLASILVIGPRSGRFLANGSEQKIQGHNMTIAILGTLLLWLGWFGFNGGATMRLNASVISILINTALGGVGGLLTMLFVGWTWKSKPQIEMVINGTLAGLVAITASCNIISCYSSVFIGAIGACFMLIVDILLVRLRIDDAIGAIPVHAGAGIWGTCAVAIFGDTSMFIEGFSRWDQLVVQLIASVICFTWSFGIAYISLNAANSFIQMRVTDEEEKLGLNITEHGASTELLDLLLKMEEQSQSGDFTQHVPVEPFTEVGQVASRYNRVLDKVLEESTYAKRLMAEVENAKNETDHANLALGERVRQLDTFNRLAIGRELRMVELKQKLNEYAINMGEDPPYKLDDGAQLSNKHV